jgi:N-dimethylarginine dimethylaminohydrolase
MKQVLMCHPDHFDVVYDINPWMTGNQNFVNKDHAVQQWNLLYAMIRSCASVQLIDPDTRCPDMVFTANAGFQFSGRNVILSNFKYEQRRFEEDLFLHWFKSNGYTIHMVNHNFEGQGDMLEDAEGNIWLGTGFRTDWQVAQEIESIIGCFTYPLELVDPRWYHLDTCFCPLPNGELMWYPEAFSVKSQELIRDIFSTTIDVDEHDALSFACNSVCLLNNVFGPACSKDVGSMLKKLGYNHLMFDLSEFMKAGGAAKCLVMDIHELR